MNVPVNVTHDHWWWRPGWRKGRSFYTWHITFSTSSEIREIVSFYTPIINRINTLDPVEIGGVHLTLQGVGFTDEVSSVDIERIIASTISHCANLAPIKARLEVPRVDEETIQMEIHPIGSVVQLKRELRNAIGEVWGSKNIPETMDGFRPHVTLAYSNGATPIERINMIMRENPLPAVEVLISSISLIDLHRDHRRYEWTEIATVTLGRDLQ